jgi:hypothetical protein
LNGCEGGVNGFRGREMSKKRAKVPHFGFTWGYGLSTEISGIGGEVCDRLIKFVS